MSFKKQGMYFLILCFLCLQLSPAYAITFDKIIVFGDSLSDNGNVFSLTSKAHQKIPRIPVVPKEPPYFQGRFTNGQVWIEHLAVLLNAPLDDYAYGGAWIESVWESKQPFPFGLGMQVNFYLVNEFRDNERANHLYVIWMGANDYVQGRPDVEAATSNTIATLKKQIDWLVYYGGKNFLLLNLPDLSMTPEVLLKGPVFAENIYQLSANHNLKFLQMLDELKKQYQDVNFLTVDIEKNFSDMIANPEKYHLKNISQACYDGGFYYRKQNIDVNEIDAAKQANIDIMKNASLRVAYLTARAAAFGEQPCNNPDEYLFWDPIHPTKIVHQLLADYSFQALMLPLNKNG